MTPDPIIEELHRIRAEIAAQFHYDVFAIGAMLQARQRAADRPVVSFSAPPPEATPAPTDKAVEQAEELSAALLDFSTRAEAEAWLQQHPPLTKAPAPASIVN